MKACPSGKVRHRSRFAAQKMHAFDLSRSGVCSTYWCKDCGSWHVTSQPPRLRRVDG